MYAESIALDTELVAQSEALLDQFGWQGVAMVEFKREETTGTPYLMEINGRFWGSLQLAISAGVDFPALLVALARGEFVNAVDAYRIGVRNRWWWGDVDHLITRLRHSNTALSLPSGSPSRTQMLFEFIRWRRTDMNEILQRDDARPFFRETARWFWSR